MRKTFFKLPEIFSVEVYNGNGMAKLQFLGAAGIVTGSSYLLTDNNTAFLIDVGMFQGVKNEAALNSAPFSFDARAIKAVFLTHAHLDHCGRLPLLIKAGFTGKVYATQATKDLVQISLLDAAAIQEEDKEATQLYTKDDVIKTVAMIETIPYDTPLSLGDYTVTFKNAGHILGSASIVIAHNGKTIVFSGDLGNTPERLIKPTETISHAEVVIMESTYGNTTHPKEDVIGTIQKEVTDITSSGGVLLIPAFSIERTQEILHAFSHLLLKKALDPSLPIFLDSPMAIEVTEVFKKYPNSYCTELAHDKHPFDFPNLVCTKSVQESKDILKAYSPKIIIAGSGMMSGGRILHHLNNYLADPKTRLLIVGYQAVGTLGREILDGASFIHLYEHKVPVRAAVTKLEGFSSHADQLKLLKWLAHIKGAQQIFLTHGETAQRESLAASIRKSLSIQKIFLPMQGDSYEID